MSSSDLCFLLHVLKGRALGNPIVTDVQPRRIGYGGGAVTIHGQARSSLFFKWNSLLSSQGFSEDVFSQFDPVLGNKVRIIDLFSLIIPNPSIQVWFANEFVSVVCKTPISSNFLLENPQDPSTTRITCHLPPRMGSQGSNWFNLILKVLIKCNNDLHSIYLRRYLVQSRPDTFPQIPWSKRLTGSRWRTPRASSTAGGTLLFWGKTIINNVYQTCSFT